MNSSKEMFLIQRKSDGKFYREGGYNYTGIQDFSWTKVKTDGKLFKSTSGARNSRGWLSDIFVRNEITCSLCDEDGTRRHTQEHYKHWKWRKRSEEELPYRIVPVKVSVD